VLSSRCIVIEGIVEHGGSIQQCSKEEQMKGQIDLRGKAITHRPGRICDAASLEAHVTPRFAGLRILSLLGSGERGSALVEIALILPMLLVLITGLCAFGVAFNNELTLTSAVGAGGQYLQLIRTSTTDPCADTLNAIESAAPGLNGSKISLTFNLNGTPASGNSCAGDQSDLVQGAPVTITATYPCSLPIYGLNLGSGCQLSAKVTEYEY
jgi:Flp pilus assembly protein TadG